MRPLEVNIDLNALKHNLSRVKVLAPKSKIMAVLKANAYGHGLIEAARAMNSADGFAVLNLTEAINLREHGFDQKILLLEGFFDTSEINICSNMNIEPVIHSNEQIMMIKKTKLKYPIDIHLKFNTGMNRLGFICKESDFLIDDLRKNSKIRDITLMTHFATADEDIGIEKQMSKFRKVINKQSLDCSLANSAAIINFPESCMDWVRPGIMLYGASPFINKKAHQLKLEAAMTMKSKIISVQNLKKDEFVGYGNVFKATKDTRVGIVACGYADGYPRHAPSGTAVSVNGIKTKTIGRVSMDMLYVDITNIQKASIGSNVELWGKQISVDDVAQSSGTVGYELLCSVSSSKRVPIGYIHGKK